MITPARFITILNDFLSLFGEQKAIELLTMIVSIKSKRQSKEEILFLLVDFVSKAKGIQNQLLKALQTHDKVYYLYRSMIFYIAINTLGMSYRQVAKAFGISHTAVFHHCSKFDRFLLSQETDKEAASLYITLKEFCNTLIN